MAAPAGSRSSTHNNAGMEGFPFPVAGRPPEESTSKDQTTTGEPKKKPCRACTDFKSWMKLHKQTSSASVQVNRLWSYSHVSPWLPERRERDLHLLYRYGSREVKYLWKQNTLNEMKHVFACYMFEKSICKGLDFWHFKLSFNFFLPCCSVVYCSIVATMEYIYFIVYIIYLFSLKFMLNNLFGGVRESMFITIMRVVVILFKYHGYCNKMP